MMWKVINRLSALGKFSIPIKYIVSKTSWTEESQYFKQKVMRHISMSIPKSQKEEIEVIFVRASGEKIRATGKSGDTLLDVIVNNSIDLDGFGACEGTLTCSTCHLVFSPEDYNKLPDKPSDEECDMLDLAYDLTDTSRLGCQITLTKEMNGLEVKVPATINDVRNAS